MLKRELYFCYIKKSCWIFYVSRFGDQKAKQLKSLQLKSLFWPFCCNEYNEKYKNKPKRNRNKPKQYSIVVKNTTMDKKCCSSHNWGNDVKSTTFLYKSVLKKWGFCASMKSVEMTKTKNLKQKAN